jgi:hypothetical protein
MLTSCSIAELAVLDALNGGVVVLNAREQVVHWNAWMASTSGHSKAHV